VAPAPGEDSDVVDPIKLAQAITGANSAVANKPLPKANPMTSLRPRLQAPTQANPALKPSAPALGTTPANMTMSQGPMPATAATSPDPMPVTPRSDVGMRGGVGLAGNLGTGAGPAPKTAEAAADYLKQRLKAVQPPKLKLPKPPSLKQPTTPEVETSFVPKKPKVWGGAQAGSTQGTT